LCSRGRAAGRTPRAYCRAPKPLTTTPAYHTVSEAGGGSRPSGPPARQAARTGGGGRAVMVAGGCMQKGVRNARKQATESDGQRPPPSPRESPTAFLASNDGECQILRRDFYT
jgi:hypothetical protein